MNDEVNPADLVRPSTVIGVKVADLPAKWRHETEKAMRGFNSDELARGWRVAAAQLEAALARQEADKTSAPVGQEWTDEQCIEFASCAFRNAPRNPPEGVELTDIRMAASRVMRSAPPAAQAVDLDAVRECLGEIADLSTALRHGGPAPEDLHGLSDALEEATSIAYDMCKIIDQQAGKGVSDAQP